MFEIRCNYEESDKLTLSKELNCEENEILLTVFDGCDYTSIYLNRLTAIKLSNELLAFSKKVGKYK